MTLLHWLQDRSAKLFLPAQQFRVSLYLISFLNELQLGSLADCLAAHPVAALMDFYRDFNPSAVAAKTQF